MKLVAPLRLLLRVALGGAVALVLAFAAGALAIDGPGAWAAGAFGALVLAALLLVRPLRRGALVALAAGALVLVWWSRLAPSNDREWDVDVSRLPRPRLEGDRLVVSELRTFDYAADGTPRPRWEERTYDLARLTGVDAFLSDWGAPGIVHTILSWEFDDGQHLAISIETRRERGEEYSALRGFFRQYELYYVMADERDVIGLRTNVRGERVRMYRFGLPADEARGLLQVYVERIARLEHEPAWYNALTHNCTTTIRLHAQDLGVHRPWNWRLLINGHVDELLYDRGFIDRSLPFAELRARSDVTGRAKADGLSPDFSRAIRADLPARPTPGAAPH